ncbi:MAG: MBL fold metallo-hydrolase [Solirubrobacteraceae bacterium]|jgi:ribonuclease BN (tRNA processing enzyme)|nr:MBL fold metallo-hydrolase [Solirubrobacteraceae bacterium]MDP4673181.1 MBL fold metallo-hydrolase [Solirubrobacteraceae bacterium]MDP4921528.1 MBL fold metallo-hydrolase [Solirubrobacteraceae bacterium]MDP5034210.1 MBL fold metallo-hydrolase [Solirubrobacteraceae bacterium]
MQITILGKSPSAQDTGGACSGYLVETAETTILLDCGSGVFGKLRERIDYADIDAIVVSHFHGDHCLDLVPYAYALAYSPRWTAANPAPRPRLIVPAGGRDLLRQIAILFGPEDTIVDAFEVTEYEPSETQHVGDLAFSFCPVPHYIPTFAISVTAAGENGRFVFGADCAPNQQLIDFAKESDLLLIEATLREPEDDEPRGHLTATEAGQHGRAANVGRLVLTHISDELDQALSVAEAAEAFGGEVTLASEGAVFDC